MKLGKKILLNLDEFKEKNYGKRGTKKRDKLEAGYENFKMGVLFERELMQKELAQSVGNANKTAES